MISFSSSIEKKPGKEWKPNGALSLIKRAILYPRWQNWAKSKFSSAIYLDERASNGELSPTAESLKSGMSIYILSTIFTSLSWLCLQSNGARPQWDSHFYSARSGGVSSDDINLLPNVPFLAQSFSLFFYSTFLSPLPSPISSQGGWEYKFPRKVRYWEWERKFLRTFQVAFKNWVNTNICGIKCYSTKSSRESGFELSIPAEYPRRIHLPRSEKVPTQRTNLVFHVGTFAAGIRDWDFLIVPRFCRINLRKIPDFWKDS